MESYDREFFIACELNPFYISTLRGRNFKFIVKCELSYRNDQQNGRTSLKATGSKLIFSVRNLIPANSASYTTTTVQSATLSTNSTTFLINREKISLIFFARLLNHIQSLQICCEITPLSPRAYQKEISQVWYYLHLCTSMFMTQNHIVVNIADETNSQEFSQMTFTTSCSTRHRESSN